MSDLQDWSILLIAGLIVVLCIAFGIECVKDANRTIERCKDIQDYCEWTLKSMRKDD